MKSLAKELGRDHPIALAGRLMFDLYFRYEGKQEPCRIVGEQFPQLSADQILCLWVGITMSECKLQEVDKIELVVTS